MSCRLPTRLASEPIVEVVSEVRFESANDSAVNLLPGILHEKFGPFDQQGRTFPVAIPPELFASDPSLAIRPQVVMTKGNHLIQIGSKTVSVALRAPYPGWTEFSKLACEVFDLVCNQSFISSFNWLSLKYVDVISFEDDPPRLSWLNADVTLGGISVDEQPSALRVERVDGPVTTAVQIASPVNAQRPGKQAQTGVLVDVDTIHREEFTNFAGEYRAVLDQLHTRNKQEFFSLLGKETLERLGPEYV